MQQTNQLFWPFCHRKRDGIRGCPVSMVKDTKTFIIVLMVCVCPCLFLKHRYIEHRGAIDNIFQIKNYRWPLDLCQKITSNQVFSANQENLKVYPLQQNIILNEGKTKLESNKILEKKMFGVFCVKYSLYIFNVLFAMTGIALATIGGIIYHGLINYTKFIPEEVSGLTIILIVLGVIVFVISFLGCYGAISENACMLLIYSILVVMCVMFELGTIIAASENRDRLNRFVSTSMNKTLHESNTSEPSKLAWDFIQDKLTCTLLTCCLYSEFQHR
ncbi:tetraspanin-15-like isoform X2 [Sitodiplosis mosellana]|uniref:tetraspanin-15-like isoform X2 n=1 Tax=Sitodiplosis mosellana TaxID=263140 RepID=UPI0024446E53|nr:tetraspanin-15-like isoform X2 [Sitodiplosis mosellana]